MGKAPKRLDESTVSSMRKILNSLDDKFQVKYAPEFAKLVNYSSQSDEPIHRWFRYREGYSTQLVSRLLSDIAPGKLVVDPFCGSGTTLLVAKQMGYPSIGVDVNPLSVFVAKTKTRTYTHRQLLRFEDICNTIARLNVDSPASSKPGLIIIEKVFLPEVLHTLLVIKYFINSRLDRTSHDFFFLAWLSILEQVSNVFREGNGIKYRNRKRTPNGYENIPLNIWQQSIFPENKFEYVLNIFLDRVKRMIKDAALKLKNVEVQAFVGDAMALDDFVEPNSTGLVIFSPPYVNNFNYFKAYKIELWMGDFVTNYNEMLDITHSSLRSHVETNLIRETDKNNWYPEELDNLLELINPDTLWTPRIINAIKGYFYDMHKVIENIYDCLEPSGKCSIVVGNSAYGSILIPTDSLLAEIGSSIGLEIERISIARHLTTSSQQKQALEPVREFLRESLLVMKKPKSNGHKRISENGEINYRFVSELPKFPRQSSTICYVIRNKGLTESTHVIHKYPGKFIPHIPRWAITKYLDDEIDKVILDPFCGSGTTLVEGMFAGHRTLGIDIDPLARLISKVKTTPIDEDKLKSAASEFEEKLKEINQVFRPDIPTLEHWFRPNTIQDLGSIRSAIEDWRYEDQDIYDFLIITFSSIIRRVSNADNQSLKTYVSGTHKKEPIQAIPLFINTLNAYVDRVLQLSEVSKHGGKASVLSVTDSRNLSKYWQENGLPLVDLVITSPPYIKSVDYVYNQMAEYFWIGDLFDLETQQKQNIARKNYIGSEKVDHDLYKEKHYLGSDGVDNLIDKIYERSSKHAYILYKYFLDMRSHLLQMRNILKPNATYVVVIGDSSISGMEMPTSQLIKEIAVVEGFLPTLEFAYEIRNRYMRFPRQGRGGIVSVDKVLSLSNP